MIRAYSLTSFILAVAAIAAADEPTADYIFPAGGQRGTTVDVRVGGTFFHDRAQWEMLGSGVAAPEQVQVMETVWFEGPMLHPPVSSRKEDYPRDHAATIQIAADAALGPRPWRVWTSQGVTETRVFVVGDLPEVVEQEAETGLAPMHLTLPVTANGRIFPREEIDVWTFAATAGQEITCDLAARRIGSPLQARLELRDPQGRVLQEALFGPGGDPRLTFRAESTGTYELRVHDINYEGFQQFVYRLTMTAGPFIEATYPLGGRRGESVALELIGQNVPSEAELSIPATANDKHTQSLVFGGECTNAVTWAVSDLPELREAEPNGSIAEASSGSLPAVLNGRIQAPGDVDQWKVELEKGAAVELVLAAAALGSSLDSVLSISNAEGKVLARNDDAANGNTDSRLNFTAPESGTYYVSVADRFASRGGPRFGYRLQIAPASAQPDFRLQASEDTLTVFRDLEPGADGKPQTRQPQRRRLKQPQLRVDAQRLGKFAEEIELVVEGLPPGVTVTGNKIAKGQSSTTLRFSAAYETKIGISRLTIKGVAKAPPPEQKQTATAQASEGNFPAAGEVILERVAEFPARHGAKLDHLLLAVALEAPFRVVGDFAMSFGSAGSVYEKEYRLERFGYDGPLVVRLADRQMRHLQGVTGPTIEVPAGATSFVYPVSLAPWMTLGRTSRSVVMASATVTDHDGSQHVVSYLSEHQNEQVVAVVKPGLLLMDLPQPHARLAPGGELKVPVRIRRAEPLTGQAVRLELIAPAGMEGFAAEPQMLPADADGATFVIHCAANAERPALPLILRASTLDPESPQIAEARLEVLPPQ